VHRTVRKVGRLDRSVTIAADVTEFFGSTVAAYVLPLNGPQPTCEPLFCQ